MMGLRVTLSDEDWDHLVGGWRCTALTLPAASVQAVFAGGAQLDPAWYKVDLDHGVLRWAREERPAVLLISIKLEANLTRRRTANAWRALAVVLPVLGGLGGALVEAHGHVLVARIEHPSSMPVSVADTSSRPAAKLLRLAIAAGRPYAIPGLVSWVDLDTVRADTAVRYEASQRITYVLQAANDFTASDENFQEWYHGSSSLEYLLGADPENIFDNGTQEKRWFVGFDMTPNAYRSVVTGVLRHYPDGFSDRRTDHVGRPLSSREEEYCYPNDGDVIGEVLLVVESRTLRFVGGNGMTRAYRVNPGQSPRPINPVIFGPQLGSPSRSVATVRATSIGAKENVCLVATW